MGRDEPLLNPKWQHQCGLYLVSVLHVYFLLMHFFSVGLAFKRKAENDLKEETAPLDNKKEKTEEVELKDEGQKVVIEHW